MILIETLGNLFPISSGGTPSRKEPSFYEGGVIPWIKTGDLNKSHVEIASEFITPEGLKKSSAKMFPKGTVLVAMYGATIGACSILDIDACTNQACAAFTPNELVDISYLYYFLRSKKGDFVKAGVGGAQPNISATYLKQVEIPLPPLKTQKQIAAILEKADQLRKDCQQMEKELNNLAQSVFIDMFADPVSNPKGWKKVALDELVESKNDIKCGPFGTQLAKSEFRKDGVPLWGIKNVNNEFKIPPHEFVTVEKAKKLMTYSVKPGDIVMTRKGNVGNCHIYPNDLVDGIMHSDLLRIRPCGRKVDPTFLQKQFMFSRDIEDQLRLISQGAIMAGINVTKLKSLMLLWPPMKLQLKFSDVIFKIESQLKDLGDVREGYEENFSALMQRAFKGELNLKNQAA